MSTDSVIIEAAAEHNSTLIFMHGMDETGHAWANILATKRPPNMKIICPTAPTRPITISAGILMHSWFDLKHLVDPKFEDEEGIKLASQNIQILINKEIEEGIPSNRIVLGGFSQGGALALYSALTFNKPLAGVVALSCWLPLYKQFPATKLNSSDMPILLCHGVSDPVAPFSYGQRSATFLQTFMNNVIFKSYKDLLHTSSEEEMNDIKDILVKWLN